MAQFDNALAVFQLLPKTNCRECGESTCMAFAGAVFLGNKGLAACPYVPKKVVADYAPQQKRSDVLEEDFLKSVEQMKSQLRTMDLATRAQEIGGSFNNGKLTLSILGKPFSVDEQGNVFTDLHVNPWVLGTALGYILNCEGVPLTENWVPLRELPSGRDWYRLFGQQCEKVLKTTADSYPELFADLVEIFSGKQVARQFDADVALILSPLPLIPMLVCYWQPEDGMESALNLFFDESAEKNLGIDGLYSLGVGIAQMLEKLARQHST